MPRPRHIPGYHKWISKGGRIEGGKPVPGSGGGGI
jgi:hypothetical protein